MSGYHIYENCNTLADLSFPPLPLGHPLAFVCSEPFAVQFGGDNVLLGAHVHDAIEAYVSSRPPRAPTTGRAEGVGVIPPALPMPARFMREGQLGGQNELPCNRSYKVRYTGPRTTLTYLCLYLSSQKLQSLTPRMQLVTLFPPQQHRTCHLRHRILVKRPFQPTLRK